MYYNLKYLLIEQLIFLLRHYYLKKISTYPLIRTWLQVLNLLKSIDIDNELRIDFL